MHWVLCFEGPDSALRDSAYTGQGDATASAGESRGSRVADRGPSQDPLSLFADVGDDPDVYRSPFGDLVDGDLDFRSIAAIGILNLDPATRVAEFAL